jgi:Na+-translocating ferredoxin:NAD+ oxidoreductase RnfG subunit
MKNETKKNIIALVFFCVGFLSLIIGIFFMLRTAMNTQNSTMQTVLQESLDKIIKNNYTVDKMLPSHLPVFSTARVFLISVNDEIPGPAYAVVVNATGMAGQVPLIFIQTNAKGLFFAGIYAVDDDFHDIEKYGLSPAILKTYKNKVAKLITEFSEK